MAPSEIVSYSLKEILADINEKLSKNTVFNDQLDRRMSTLETRVQSHDKILTDQLPKLQKLVEEINVQKQVEAALDSRRVRGVSTRDRVLIGGLSACLLALGLLETLPKVLGG